MYSTGQPGRDISLEAFAEKCSNLDNVDSIARAVGDANGKTQLFDYALSADYPYKALDAILPATPQNRRLFIHETFAPVDQADGEEVLVSASLRYFPAIAQNSGFTFREVPLTTARLLSHNMGPQNARIMAASFLAPTIVKLYDSTGLVPSPETMEQLVHFEDVNTVEGSDHLETGIGFLPPYRFEPISSEEFVTRAVTNALAFGKTATDLLSKELRPNFSSSDPTARNG